MTKLAILILFNSLIFACSDGHITDSRNEVKSQNSDVSEGFGAACRPSLANNRGGAGGKARTRGDCTRPVRKTPLPDLNSGYQITHTYQCPNGAEMSGEYTDTRNINSDFNLEEFKSTVRAHKSKCTSNYQNLKFHSMRICTSGNCIDFSDRFLSPTQSIYYNVNQAYSCPSGEDGTYNLVFQVGYPGGGETLHFRDIRSLVPEGVCRGEMVIFGDQSITVDGGAAEVVASPDFINAMPYYAPEPHSLDHLMPTDSNHHFMSLISEDSASLSLTASSTVENFDYNIPDVVVIENQKLDPNSAIIGIGATHKRDGNHYYYWFNDGTYSEDKDLDHGDKGVNPFTIDSRLNVGTKDIVTMAAIGSKNGFQEPMVMTIFLEGDSYFYSLGIPSDLTSLSHDNKLNITVPDGLKIVGASAYSTNTRTKLTIVLSDYTKIQLETSTILVGFQNFTDQGIANLALVCCPS